MSIPLPQLFQPLKLVVLAFAAAGLSVSCQQPPVAANAAAQSRAETAGRWSVKADYVDACNCDPACPCMYGSSPTNDHCQGATLVDIQQGHFQGIQLDGVRVVAVYSGGEWIKFYVSDNATASQAEAAVELLPAFEDFFAVSNVLEVERVPISLSREADQVRISLPNTTVEIELMRGAGGQPIQTDGLPHAGFGKALPFLDHTQYRTIRLEHRGGEQHFSYSDTTAYTARIDGEERS